MVFCSHFLLECGLNKDGHLRLMYALSLNGETVFEAHRPTYLNALSLNGRAVLGRTRMLALGCISLEVGFKVSKAHSRARTTLSLSNQM